MKDEKKVGMFSRFFGGLWNGITAVRTFMLNAIFLLLLILFISALIPKGQQDFPESTALRIAPSGFLVDQRSTVDPVSQIINRERPQDMETLVRDLVTAINAAKDDDRITAIVLELENLYGGGISKLEEVGQALDNFKTSGKTVYAAGDVYSQDQYYLAAFADEIYLNPMGVVGVTGYGVYRNYFKSALDALSINVHVFKVGKYKDFVEPYIRDDMSEQSRHHTKQWVDELWANYAQRVETLRGLDSGSLTESLNNMDTLLKANNGSNAELAKAIGLVDELLPRHKQFQKLSETLGSNEEGDDYQAVDYWYYLDNISKPINPNAGRIGLLVASGNILDGEQPEGTIGGDTLAGLIQQASEENLAALVLRVDSGGGSAFASEIIRQQLLDLQEEIPVIVSMGSVAASGGYWISASSDEIWANPTTITGSIGVFGAFPTLEDSLDRLGIHTDGLATTALAGSIRLDRALSPMAESILQQGVDNVYGQFLDIVAAGRESEPDAINEIAQGRVWTGKQALELGLVDKLGSLEDVIRATAERVDLAEYEVIEIKRQLSPGELFMLELANNMDVRFSGVSWLSPLSKTLTHWLRPAINIIDELDALNDPKGLYTRCLACQAP